MGRAIRRGQGSKKQRAKSKRGSLPAGPSPHRAWGSGSPGYFPFGTLHIIRERRYPLRIRTGGSGDNATPCGVRGRDGRHFFLRGAAAGKSIFRHHGTSSLPRKLVGPI